jgi:hypothetical protein
MTVFFKVFLQHGVEGTDMLRLAFIPYVNERMAMEFGH